MLFSPFIRSPRAVIVASIVVLAGLGLWGSWSNAADKAQTGIAVKPALTVTTTQARLTTLTSVLSANGSVAAWQEAVVAAQVQGLPVKELYVNVGDSVQKGQLLATLDAETVQADVALAQAALQEATAMLAEATANADRARAVQGGGVLSAQQVSQYLTQEQTAKARLESARAQSDAQQLRLMHTRILAPDSGLISSRTAAVGAVVGVGSELFRMVRQSRLEWRAEVTAHELGRISKGLPAVVTAPDGSRWQGKVRMVSPVIDAQTRNGLVYVDLLAPKGSQNLHTALKPGMFARGELQTGTRSGLTVLQSAVVLRDGFSYVYRISEDNRVAQRKVQTGRLQGDSVEIVSGITAEDKLVATGAAFLSDGDLVRVVQAAAQ
jgi:HlyD family secretion protein